MIYWWEKAFLLAVLGWNRVESKKKTERRRNLNGDDTWISKKFESHLACKDTALVEKEDHKDVSWESLSRGCDVTEITLRLTKRFSASD